MVRVCRFRISSQDNESLAGVSTGSHSSEIDFGYSVNL